MYQIIFLIYNILRSRKSIGATIKDTRTKSRGRVEVREGGGTGWAGVEGWEKMQTIVTK